MKKISKWVWFLLGGAILAWIVCEVKKRWK